MFYWNWETWGKEPRNVCDHFTGTYVVYYLKINLQMKLNRKRALNMACAQLVRGQEERDVLLVIFWKSKIAEFFAETPCLHPSSS